MRHSRATLRHHKRFSPQVPNIPQLTCFLILKILEKSRNNEMNMQKIAALPLTSASQAGRRETHAQKRLPAPTRAISSPMTTHNLNIMALACVAYVTHSQITARVGARRGFSSFRSCIYPLCSAGRASRVKCDTCSRGPGNPAERHTRGMPRRRKLLRRRGEKSAPGEEKGGGRI